MVNAEGYESACNPQEKMNKLHERRRLQDFVENERVQTIARHGVKQRV